MQYKSKPKYIEAERLTKDNVDQITEWCGGDTVKEYNAFNHDEILVGINVPTLNGNRRASEGDFICKGDHGRFYVSKAGDFLALYDPA